jgi:hypothetical protein
MRPQFDVCPVPGGWVVEAVWPSGVGERLIGLYVTEEAARNWISGKSEAWLKDFAEPKDQF